MSTDMSGTILTQTVPKKIQKSYKSVGTFQKKREESDSEPPCTVMNQRD